MICIWRWHIPTFGMPNPHIGPALDAIEKLGFLSSKSSEQRDPLQPIWMPPVDWTPLLTLLERELAGISKRWKGIGGLWGVDVGHEASKSFGSAGRRAE